jgi:hypothetical protein
MLRNLMRQVGYLTAVFLLSICAVWGVATAISRESEAPSADSGYARLFTLKFTGDVPAFVWLMNRDYRAGVSFIEGRGCGTLSIDADAKDLLAVLDSVVEQCKGYNWSRILGRIVLHSTERQYRRKIREVEIVRVPRRDAGAAYVGILRKSSRKFKDLLVPGVLGDPEADLYSTPVSLDGEATVLEHLVQLLGDDPRVVFMITKTRTGKPWLSFEQTAPGDC